MLVFRGYPKTRERAQWVTVAHAGERMRLSVQRHAERGYIQLVFDAPESFHILRDDAKVREAR